MTLKEYLKSEVEYAKSMMIGNYDVEKLNHYEGYKEAIEAVLEQLPEMEHDVTLKEVKEICQSHFGKDGCEKCPMHATTVDCLVFGVPARLKLNEIQKRMKEARNDT